MPYAYDKPVGQLEKMREKRELWLSLLGTTEIGRRDEKRDWGAES